jgi:hypothetical protein
MSKVRQFGQELLGTGREALENYHYGKLIDDYGAFAARRMVEPQVVAAGLTWDKFEHYREVKQKVQNGALKVSAVRREAENAAKAAFDDEMS